MKITCKVIEDLLPLYHDDICSPDSKTLVDEHLRDCENCRRVLTAMDGDFELQHEDQDGQKALEGIQNTVKKSNRKAILKGIAITLVVLLLGVSVTGIVWYRTEALVYLELSERMMEKHPGVSAEYPHEYLAPTTPGQTEPEPPLWFFPREYFVGTSEYEYWLRLPGYLDFRGGAISVTPIDYLGQKDVPHISLGIQFADGKPEYIIDVIDEANDIFTIILVDGNLNFPDRLPYPSEEALAKDREILELYYEDIENILAAAKEMWDLE